MSNATKYLTDFFAEKNLRDESFEVTSENGTVNMMTTGVVIEAIYTASQKEQKAIGDTIRKIDFMNGDVNHFLKHLGQACAVLTCNRPRRLGFDLLEIRAEPSPVVFNISSPELPRPVSETGAFFHTHKLKERQREQIDIPDPSRN